MSGVLDGNDPANLASFDSGVVEVGITTGSKLRLSFDATAQGLTERYLFGVDDVLFRIVPPGNGNGDGQLNSTDLFLILATGLYNTGPCSSSSSPAAVVAVPEPSGFILAVFGLFGILALARRRMF